MALLVGAGLAPSVPVVAQPVDRKRVGIFWGFEATDAQWSERFGTFVDALQKLGWETGKNIAFEIVPAVGPQDQLPALADKLVAAKVDVIVAATGGLASVVHSATKKIPIIVGAAGDLEGTGLIASLSRPGGNVTGSQTFSPGLMSKRLSLMKELIPDMVRLGVVLPITLAAKTSPRFIDIIEEAARGVGLALLQAEVRAPDEFESAYVRMQQSGCHAVLVITNPLSLAHREKAISAARIPTMYETEPFVSEGGLISYGPAILPLYREAASYVNKILRGSKPEDLPVNQPTKFELAINLETAKSLGLAIPPTMLALADRVIEIVTEGTARVQHSLLVPSAKSAIGT